VHASLACTSSLQNPFAGSEHDAGLLGGVLLEGGEKDPAVGRLARITRPWEPSAPEKT